MTPTRLLRFGPFEFDVRAGDLLKHGVRIHLQDQASQILHMLLDHPGEVVLRSEIRQGLWPGDTVVDFDQSINSAVKRLRNALGESADSPRYIETISKRGYRFIAEVQRDGETQTEHAPAVVSDYRLLEKLDEDGIGVRYRAEDLKLGRQVAVKVLHVTNGELPQPALLRFQQEVGVAASLHHPHICTILRLEEFDGRPGIVMELVGGETLAERLSRGPLPLRDALRIGLQTAGALSEAHAAGTVHGNLQPANIMLTKNGVKVMDFGLAMMEAGDARCDISSLGLLLYEMVTGKPLSDSADEEALCEVPPAIAPFLIRCLARNPEARWQSVGEAQADLERLAREDSKPVAAPQQRSRRLYFLAAVAAGLAIGTGVYLKFGGSSPGPPMRAIPLTTLTGEQNFPAFSPDGEKVAFSWVGPPRQGGRPALNIYVKSIVTGGTIAVTNGPTDDRFPAWSPDGSEIAFQRVSSTGLDLLILPSGGGTERKIADSGFGFAWSPDGSEMAYVAPSASGNGGILVRSLRNGGVRQLTSPQSRREGGVAWSPDGKQIAFTRNLAGSVRELFVVSSQGGEPRQLTFDNASISGFAWTPDSRELVFDSTRKSGANLWRIQAAGGTPERVAYAANHPASPSVSLRGNRLVYSDSFVDSNIWQYEFTGPAMGAAPLLQPPKCLICSTVEDDSPRLSPDGRRIVFISWRSGSEELWTAGSDGNSPQQLTSLGGRAGSPRWSPDGRWIAFDSRAGGSSDVYVIGAAGGTPRRLTPESSLEIEPSWSQSGRWIYFVSDRGGQSHIWKVPFEGGPARQVTQADGGESLESADGKRLYYFRREHNDGIWSTPVEGGLEEVVPELSRVKRTRAWTVRAEGIYFYQEIDSKPLVQFFDFATRRVSTILTLERPSPGNPGLDISPDGRKLLYTQIDRRMDGLMMIENFR